MIDKLNNKASYGHDNISNNLIKSAKEVLVEPLTLLVNQMFKSGHFHDTVRLMTAFFLSTEASFLAENFRYIMYTYNIPMFTWYIELSVLLKCVTCPSSLSDIELSNIDTIRELLSIRDEVLICPISHSAAGTLIDDICIS